ncbi:bifunctional 4-hydroxy-2-oxoglutarate aldolase/2-dehydro-3-deoxy-phosphogluconate aldolase [Flavihumibacter petaseus]|uniref:2-keto-3-deoxy-6-phosphogluconate/4-hydroxy-2-oxoglutarate aldolase n=1 Tax=Flavihumibacter petaseus NBRC 106054 TaxID=1220578 RepID=A0A0E9N589_9BACT|nr:bifunctional 4-hydroxy-2-oxoglutarate aldolase/2-dehydro-3-deoxy-phosphogluconate aldolase [Flavihumibacter petaseus]GAO45127.1 2-keto-3-deoxy-6-phosphogluconate/4-hydroxy-2-oxoglutarate aldolase [Flavihumibacter petaseus NBRC 106054]
MTALSHILQHQVIAIVRGLAYEDFLPVAKALSAGGVRIMEITLNTPRALEGISMLSDHFDPDTLLVGAGTVLDAVDVTTAVQAGAKFIISPHTDLSIIQKSRELGAVSIPGAFTPTEVVAAYRNGGEIIKLFPAAGGLAYLKDIRAPLDKIPLMPTGGIDASNIRQYSDAGAVAFGIGSSLLGKGPLDLQRVTENAANLLRHLRPEHDNKNTLL